MTTTEGNEPPAIPSNSPSAAASDPGAPTNVMPAPTPGAPTAGTDNILTMVVPTDSTVLQMGASACGPDLGVAAISGFRVSTATHAHITAQSPATTISLGAAGGMGMGGTAGLSLYSAGNKDERITGTVYEEYKSTRETHVANNGTETWGGDLSVYVGGETSETWQKAHKMNSQDTRLDEVNGECTQIYHSDLAQTMYGKVETKIAKDWEQTVTGNMEITCQEMKVTQKGDVFWSCFTNEKKATFGMVSELVGGLKTDLVIGARTDITLGAETAVAVGAKTEIVGAVFTHIGAMDNHMKAMHVQLHGAKKALAGLKQQTAGLTNVQFGLSNTVAGLKDVVAGLETTEAGLKMMG